MRRITVTKRFTFCAAHRLPGHEGGCANIHGHNYVVELTFEHERQHLEEPQLDEMGMVLDFGKLKVVGDWIDRNWDHKAILFIDDPEFAEIPKRGPGLAHQPARWPSWHVFWLDRIPTAENMALHLQTIADSAVRPLGAKCVRVRVQETEKCWAEVTA